MWRQLLALASLASYHVELIIGTGKPILTAPGILRLRISLAPREGGDETLAGCEQAQVLFQDGAPYPHLRGVG